MKTLSTGQNGHREGVEKKNRAGASRQRTPPKQRETQRNAVVEKHPPFLKAITYSE